MKNPEKMKYCGPLCGKNKPVAIIESFRLRVLFSTANVCLVNSTNTTYFEKPNSILTIINRYDPIIHPICIDTPNCLRD